MSSAEPVARRTGAPRILCAGIIVLDEVFRVDEFPRARRQGAGRRTFSSSMVAVRPMPRWRSRGLAAAPHLPDRWADLPAKTTTATACSRRSRRDHVDCGFCQRIDGLATALSAIFMNARGDRTIVTYRDERIAATAPADPAAAVAAADAVLADNRYPDFVDRSARPRGQGAFRWCSTATGRRKRTIRCSALPRM